MGFQGGAGGTFFTLGSHSGAGGAPTDLKIWNLMFAGAVLCAAACVTLVWMITATGDVSAEWVVWVLVLAGFGLLAGGYLSETRYRRGHPDEHAEGKGQ